MNITFDGYKRESIKLADLRPGDIFKIDNSWTEIKDSACLKNAIYILLDDEEYDNVEKQMKYHCWCLTDSNKYLFGNLTPVYKLDVDLIIHDEA